VTLVTGTNPIAAELTRYRLLLTPQSDQQSVTN
jgi:hypothetical protein